MAAPNPSAVVAFLGLLLVIVGGVNIFGAWAAKNLAPLIFGEWFRSVTDDPQVSEFYAGKSRLGWALTLLGLLLVVVVAGMSVVVR